MLPGPITFTMPLLRQQENTTGKVSRSRCESPLHGHTLHSLWTLVDGEGEVIQQRRHTALAGRDVSGVQDFAGYDCIKEEEEAAGKC